MSQLAFNEYIDDLSLAINSFLNDAKSITTFKTVYKKAIAAYNVLNSWSNDNLELIGGAAGVTKRVIALLCIRQYSLVNVELRRFIECISFYSYFTDHPVEWEYFKSNPARSWKNKPVKPIEIAANSPINYYLRYLDERISAEPSGLAKESVDIFRNEYDKVSIHIHGGMPAMQGSLALAFDREDPQIHNELNKRCYKIFKSGCIIIAALNVKLLEELNTTNRLSFDKLVSPSTARKIKNNPFGIQ